LRHRCDRWRKQILETDLMNSVHGLAQSAWDVRRLLTWLRSQHPQAIGMYGISLGGYVTALTSAFESDLDCVIAGIPVCDFPDLFGWHSQVMDMPGGVYTIFMDGTRGTKTSPPRMIDTARIARTRGLHNIWVSNGYINQEPLIALCRENLADYKKPRHVVFVEELPLSPVGKISRKDLRSMAP